MAYSETALNDIFDKTDGRCACCGKQLGGVVNGPSTTGKASGGGRDNAPPAPSK